MKKEKKTFRLSNIKSTYMIPSSIKSTHETQSNQQINFNVSSFPILASQRSLPKQIKLKIPEPEIQIYAQTQKYVDQCTQKDVEFEEHGKGYLFGKNGPIIVRYRGKTIMNKINQKKKNLARSNAQSTYDYVKLNHILQKKQFFQNQSDLRPNYQGYLNHEKYLQHTLKKSLMN